MTTPREPVEQLARLRQHLTEHRPPDEGALEVTRAMRDHLEEALKGRRITEGSLFLARKRRLRERLDVLDDHLVERRWEEALEELNEVRTFYLGLLEEAQSLPTAPRRVDRANVPPWARNALTVARKELVVILQGVQGIVLFALFLLTFGLGLEAALGESNVAGVPGSVALVWTYAHSLDFLSAPLAGVLVGHSLLNEERTSHTIHFLASKPVSREGIVLGKWAGMAGALGLIVAAAAFIVGGVAFAVTRRLGDPGAVVLYVVATYGLALAFATLALALSAAIDRGAGSLAGSVGAYLLLGPVWQNAFLVRSLQDLSAGPGTAAVLIYLASPFTAWWNWTSELLGPESDVAGLPVGEPWHAALVEAVERGTRESLPFYATHPWYVLVMVAWVVLGILLAVRVLGRRDLA